MSPQARARVRFLWRRLAGAVAAACLLLGALPATGLAGPATDPSAPAPDVAAAQARLEQARAAVTTVESALDHAAAEFERAWAHSLRLGEELGEVAGGVARAEARTLAAQEALRRRMAAAYRAPHADLALAGAILDAPDAGTALHVASLMSRMAVRSAAELDGRRAAERRAAHALRQRRVLALGATRAARERQERGAALQSALAQARKRAREAEVDLRRARAAARQGAAVAVRADGKACPVGGPNGFVDSWGAPRSGGRRHQGVDIFAEYGTPLLAVADGTVRRVWVNRLGGLSIDLLDEQGDRSYYAHLSSAAVHDGQRVRAGEVIGAVGDSGNARGTPPHLHWQYHPGDGPPVNPYPLARALCR